jgi:hypothetical protein
MGFNQLAGGVGGGIAGANTLFNSNGGLFPNVGSGVGSGISGLFGGGDQTLLNTATDFAGGAVPLAAS